MNLLPWPPQVSAAAKKDTAHCGPLIISEILGVRSPENHLDLYPPGISGWLARHIHGAIFPTGFCQILGAWKIPHAKILAQHFTEKTKLERLREEIREGRVVALAVRNKHRVGHWVLLLALEGEDFLLYDPAQSEPAQEGLSHGNRRVSPEELLSHWTWRPLFRLDNFAITIGPPPIT